MLVYKVVSVYHFALDLVVLSIMLVGSSVVDSSLATVCTVYLFCAHA